MDKAVENTTTRLVWLDQLKAISMYFVVLGHSLLKFKEGKVFRLSLIHIQMCIRDSPSDASRSVTWRTGNSKVANIDKNGKVTAVNAGNTYILSLIHI